MRRAPRCPLYVHVYIHLYMYGMRSMGNKDEPVVRGHQSMTSTRLLTGHTWLSTPYCTPYHTHTHTAEYLPHILRCRQGAGSSYRRHGNGHRHHPSAHRKWLRYLSHGRGADDSGVSVTRADDLVTLYTLWHCTHCDTTCGLPWGVLLMVICIHVWNNAPDD